MRQKHRDRSLGDGVYFAPQDYIGLSPRIVILIVDFLVILAILMIVAFCWLFTVGADSLAFPITLLAAVWLYFVPLKRSKFRTIGYRITGGKLVTLKGDRPSLMMLTFRSLFWIFGPFNFFLCDLIWCGVDEDRQALRDRFT